MVCLEYFDFVRVRFEAVLSVCAVAEGLVAGASAPTVRLHYLPINDDWVKPVSRGTDDSCRRKTLDSFDIIRILSARNLMTRYLFLTPNFPESASFHLTLQSLEYQR